MIVALQRFGIHLLKLPSSRGATKIINNYKSQCFVRQSIVTYSSSKLRTKVNNEEGKASPHHGDTTSEQLQAIGKSGLWVVSGIALASAMPTTAPLSVSIFGLSYFATRAAQPLVNTKLAVQREKQQQETTADTTTTTMMKHSTGIYHFLYQEGRLFYNKLTTIGLGRNAHAGGNTYALRGAFAKMMTFAGYEVILDLLSPVLVCHGIPHFIVVPVCGFLSGSLQGTLIAIPEYFSTLQSRFPYKSNSQLFAEMWSYTKLTWGLPVVWVALRNGVFDMIFNSLRIELGVPFGLSAVIAMTMNYPIERLRSLTHQHELVSLTKLNTNTDSKFNLVGFQGWMSKAIEFFSIYQLLQILKEIGS